MKAGHLRRDPRASIVVCEDGPPNGGLELQARARLSTLEDGSIVRRIATRYLGPEEGELYVVTAGDDLLIRLEPGELRAWDFADYSPEPPVCERHLERWFGVSLKVAASSARRQ